MVDDRSSPSAGWRAVHHAMAADPDVEEPVRACPDCGRRCEHVLRDAYECAEHGVFRATDAAGDGSLADESDEGDSHRDESGESDSRADHVRSEDSGDSGESPDGARDPNPEDGDATGESAGAEPARTD